MAHRTCEAWDLALCALNGGSIAPLVGCGVSEERSGEGMELFSSQIPEKHLQQLRVYMLICTTRWCTKKSPFIQNPLSFSALCPHVQSAAAAAVIQPRGTAGGGQKHARG